MSRTKKWKKMEIDIFRRTHMMMDEEEERENIMKHLEINEDDVEEVQKYIPLYYAAVTDDCECLAKFLNSGEFEKDINLELFTYAKYRKCNITPLHIAASKGNTECVQMLINCGTDVNVADHHHITPLHYAAKDGNYKMLKMLLEAGADCSIPIGLTTYPESTKYATGFTALHLAAKHNRYVECVKELLRFGADCSARDYLNRTPLFVAAEAGNEECILYLLRNTCCKSFLSVPCSNAASYIPLHFAVMNGMLECVKEMVHLGSDINHRNGNGMSPLHIICRNETLKKSVKMEILKVLVLEGHNTDMNSVFHPSFFHKYTSEVKAFLIAYGANMDVRSIKTGLKFFEHELLYHLDRDFLKFVTKGMPTLPFLHSLKIYPVIEDMPNKSTMWYSSILPNNVTFSLVRGKNNTYVEMSSNQGNYSSYSSPILLDTVINRPLKKLLLLQQPFLDLLYNHIYEKLKDGGNTNYEFISFEYNSSRQNSSPKRQVMQLLHHLWYQKLASEPLPLMHHCRYSIRKCMGPSNVKHVNKLPLPPSLKSYLLFDYSG